MAAGLSLSAMARRTHFSKPYLGLIETGKRPASPKIVKAYEAILGMGGLGADMDRRSFIAATAAVALSPRTIGGELAASVAGNDPNPLATVQTTYEADLAVASIVDRGAVRSLRRWMIDGEPILRVNAAGILAKLPGQDWSETVVQTLGHDSELRDRYLTAVVARVMSTDRPTAATMVRDPRMVPRPALAAEKFAREAVNPVDAGARWCSGAMLQRLSPALGGGA